MTPADKVSDNGPVQYKYPSVFRWNIDDDFYKDGIQIYSDGLCEINVGGMVCGMSLKKWFECASEIDRLKSEVERLNFVSTSYMNEMHRLASICEQLRREKERLIGVLEKVDQWFERMKADHHSKLVEGQTLETASENWNSLLQEPLDMVPIKKVLSDLRGEK